MAGMCRMEEVALPFQSGLRLHLEDHDHACHPFLEDLGGPYHRAREAEVGGRSWRHELQWEAGAKTCDAVGRSTH